jgi:pimeloyl-ACP methyl ester carboxylesterase
MTTFAMVHGAWHDGSCWELLAPLLEHRGHRVVAPDLPISDRDASFEDYAQVVLDALGEDEEPFVLVGHSLGSDTIPLVAVRRAPVRLVYVCPRLGGFTRRPPGEPRAFRAPERLPRDNDEGLAVWAPDDAVQVMYPRLHPALAQRMIARLRPQAGVFRRPYPLAAPPPGIPAALIYAADDEFFEPEWSRWAARELLGVEPVEMPGGHFPMLERPQELAEVLCGFG